MNLQEIIKNDLKIAMKNKQHEVVSILRVVIGEFSREGYKNLSDDEVIKILRRVSNDAIETNSTNEAEILNKYLPQMYDEDKLNTIVKEIIDENELSTMKDLGKLMGMINKRNDKNKIDNKLTSTIGKKLLS